MTKYDTSVRFLEKNQPILKSQKTSLLWQGAHSTDLLPIVRNLFLFNGMSRETFVISHASCSLFFQKEKDNLCLWLRRIKIYDADVKFSHSAFYNFDQWMTLRNVLRPFSILSFIIFLEVFYFCNGVNKSGPEPQEPIHAPWKSPLISISLDVRITVVPTSQRHA